MTNTIKNTERIIKRRFENGIEKLLKNGKKNKESRKEYNLQVIPANKNLIKSNKFKPGPLYWTL